MFSSRRTLLQDGLKTAASIAASAVLIETVNVSAAAAESAVTAAADAGDLVWIPAADVTPVGADATSSAAQYSSMFAGIMS